MYSWVSEGDAMIYMPKTLVEAVRYYADEQVCINTVAALRWPNGKPVCPKCGVEEGDRKHYWLAAQKRWKCYSCRKQFSVKVGTIFEDSPLGLDTCRAAHFRPGDIRKHGLVGNLYANALRFPAHWSK